MCSSCSRTCTLPADNYMPSQFNFALLRRITPMCVMHFGHLKWEKCSVDNTWKLKYLQKNRRYLGSTIANDSLRRFVLLVQSTTRISSKLLSFGLKLVNGSSIGIQRELSRNSKRVVLISRNMAETSTPGPFITRSTRSLYRTRGISSLQEPRN